MPLDPVSAIANAITAFFTFLNSTQGQGMIDDIRKVNQSLNADIAKMCSFLGANAASRTPAAEQPK